MTFSRNGDHQPVNGNDAPEPAWSDEALIRHAQAHPEASEAFTLLHARHAGWLVKRARRMISASEAEDVSQETFLYLWRKLPSLERPFRLTGLLSNHCQGLPCVEIAEAEGVPAATVRWRIHAAIKKLRDRKDFSNVSPRSSVNRSEP